MGVVGRQGCESFLDMKGIVHSFRYKGKGVWCIDWYFSFGSFVLGGFFFVLFCFFVG